MAFSLKSADSKVLPSMEGGGANAERGQKMKGTLIVNDVSSLDGVFVSDLDYE